MRSVLKVYRGIGALCGSLMLFFSAQPAMAEQDGQAADQNPQLMDKGPTPVGYRGYLTLVSNGVYESPDGTIFLDGMAGDGLAFQKNIMGRSQAEIAQNRQEAIEHFAQRFGINVVDNPDIFFTGYQIDPSNNLRAYAISGEQVGPEGWTVHDGGWQALVTNPNGIMLGGEFAGTIAPVNTVFLFGDYKIVPPRAALRDSHKDPIVISYRSRLPVFLTEYGALFRCELRSERFGGGLVSGTDASALGTDGMLHSNVRAVMTFPPLPDFTP